MKPIIVWTMGKVGSRSVTRTLENAGFETLHIHYFEYSKLQEVRKHGQLKIVNLVRDPLARNLSAMFQNIDKNYPAWPTQTGQQLMDRFAGKYNQAIPDEWFEDELHRFTKLDTFKTFDRISKWGACRE